MNLLIVESPAKAKTIGKYLGDKFIVLASLGHVRDIPSRDGSVLPNEDFKIEYNIIDRSKKYIQELVRAAKQSETIYLATDPDREGEAISWHVIEVLKEKKAVKADAKIHRVVFNEITKKSVQDAIKNPRDLDFHLINSQQARRALDYLVGFTLSPILWRKLPGSRSAGRVQSVALRLICDREDEIERFTAREYWSIKADLNSSKEQKFLSTLTHVEDNKLDKFDIPNEARSSEIVARVENQDFKVLNIEEKKVKRHPSPPFITSTLQQDASRKLGFSAKMTMNIAQKLYEGLDIDGSGSSVGLITYMRTDGLYMADEAIKNIRGFIGDHFDDKYLPKDVRKYQSKSKNAQEAHEAIRPTDVNLTPDSIKSYLSDEQFKLYNLVWKRTVACQMESATLDQCAIIIETIDQYAKFKTTGSILSFDGFYKVYRESSDTKDSEGTDKLLPPLKIGEICTLNLLLPEQHFTQPPPRYTEASLIKKMEELSIGRPSTYAAIISVLQDREYVKLDKKRFFPEIRGRVVTAFLISFFTQYVEYDFTADLERDLDKIASGGVEWKDILRQFWKAFILKIEAAKEHTITDVLNSLNDIMEYCLFYNKETKQLEKNCSECNKGSLNLKIGKFGVFIGCSNYPECKHIRNVGDEYNLGDGSKTGDEEFPDVLGKDPKTGEDILIKKGPYGTYLQLGEIVEKGKKKPSRATIPDHIKGQDLTLDLAVQLLSLPRMIGAHPETGKDIKAGIGRFGPYVVYDGVYVSIKDPDDVFTVELPRALEVIEKKMSTKKFKDKVAAKAKIAAAKKGAAKKTKK